MTPRRRRILSTLAVVLGAWGSAAIIDGAGRAGESESLSSGQPADLRSSGGGRAFVLLVDSFRAETALGLPAVRDLLGRAAFVRVRNAQDAATVSAIRAAFTGEAQRSIFAFARNFVKVGGGWSSIFRDLAARDQTSAVFSDGAFFELRAGITERLDNQEPADDEDDERGQRRAFERALARYADGRDRLVIFHLTFGDHAAHATGVGTARYTRAFGLVDALIKEADAAVPASDTLAVFGDHGHDVAGRHFPGLEVPTVALYRGPGFAAGTAAGPLPLTVHRYLLSWALGLPLPPGFRGGAAPELLRSDGPLPEAFASRPAPLPSVGRRSVRLAWMLPFFVAVAVVAAQVAHRLAPAALSRRASLAAAAALVSAFVAWGFLLAQWRLARVPNGAGRSWTIWLGALALAAGVAGTGLAAPMSVAWVALATPALLLYPSAGHDGWADGMGRVWALALVVLVVGWARRRALPGGRGRPTTPSERLALAALPLLAFCVMPFFYAETDGLTFNWAGHLTSNRILFWIALSIGVRGVLFLRPERGPVASGVGLALVALFSISSFGDALATGPARLAAAGVLAAAAVAARRHGATRAAASTLTNAALLMAFRGSVVLDERVLLQLELLLAALRVSLLVGRALGRPEDARPLTAWLEAMALLVTTWSTLALTLSRLEWRFLYDFFRPASVERHVWLFLPLIVGRYTLPLIVARRLLHEARAEPGASSWPGAFGAAAVKAATLALVASGYALFDPTSELSVQAIANLLTFSTPLLALAYEPAPQGEGYSSGSRPADR